MELPWAWRALGLHFSAALRCAALARWGRLPNTRPSANLDGIYAASELAQSTGFGHHNNLWMQMWKQINKTQITCGQVEVASSMMWPKMIQHCMVRYDTALSLVFTEKPVSSWHTFHITGHTTYDILRFWFTLIFMILLIFHAVVLKCRDSKSSVRGQESVFSI